MKRFWAELTTREAARLGADAIAILPVAAVEQHGPHLPLGTDLHIAEGYIARILPLLPPAPVFFLPVQAVGASAEHLSFAGTVSLEPETALEAWEQVCAAPIRAGVRRLILMNTHGGNVPVIDLLARRLRQQHGVLAVTASMHRFGYPDGLFTPEERAHGIHGGEIETSLMLAFRPDLVDLTQAADFSPWSRDMEGAFRQLRANHPIGFGWMSEDLHPTGAMGNAAAASAAKGQAAAEHGARAFVQLLEDVRTFDLGRFGN